MKVRPENVYETLKVRAENVEITVWIWKEKIYISGGHAGPPLPLPRKKCGSDIVLSSVG